VSGAAVAASLPEMLGRLRLTAMRDRLDGLLDEAARRDLTLPEALALLCEAEVAHHEERRIQMGLGIAKFPCVRTLEGFDFAAQPSLDPKQVRELAACRWVANGDTLLVQGPPGVGKSHLAVARCPHMTQGDQQTAVRGHQRAIETRLDRPSVDW